MALNQTTAKGPLFFRGKEFSWPKLIFLSFSSVVLSSSMFLAIFNAFPLALAGLLYGRSKAFVATFLGLVFSALICWKIFPNPALIFAQVLGSAVGICLQEIILRKVAPMKGVLSAGGVLVLVLGLLMAGTLMSSLKEVKALVHEQVKAYGQEVLKNKEGLVNSGEEENLQAVDLLERPDILTEQILQAVPAVLFTGAFLWFWVNMLILLRLQRNLLFAPSYPYSETDLLSYHVPQWVLIPTIAAMTLTFFGDMSLTPNPVIAGGVQDASAWGKSALQMIGVFYFFQGMGIYLDFLDTLNFKGPLRHLLVLATVVTGPWVIALFGLFDLWVNFRRFFRPQTDSGQKKGE